MGLRHRNFQSTQYVVVVRNGKVVKSGLGLGFFYNSLTTSIKVIPSTTFDTNYAFDDITTKDFQKITVQGDISYKIKDYELASSMVDFSYIDKQDYGIKLSDAQVKMAKRLTGIVKAEIAQFMAVCDIRTAIQSQNELAKRLNESIKDNSFVGEFGLAVINISVLAILPQAETRKALEAATREEILKQQDDAVYKRRNFAIEQERIIKENEINTEIKVVEKEREKDEKTLDAQMSLQEKTAQANMQKLTDDNEYNKTQRELKCAEQVLQLEDKIKINQAENDYKMAMWTKCIESDEAMHDRQMVRRQYEKEEQSIDNETQKSIADTKAYANEIILKAFEKVDKEVLMALLLSEMDSKTMIAKAFGDIANNTNKIGNLNISPDLLSSLLHTENE